MMMMMMPTTANSSQKEPHPVFVMKITTTEKQDKEYKQQHKNNKPTRVTFIQTKSFTKQNKRKK